MHGAGGVCSPISIQVQQQVLHLPPGEVFGTIVLLYPRSLCILLRALTRYSIKFKLLLPLLPCCVVLPTNHSDLSLPVRLKSFSFSLLLHEPSASFVISSLCLHGMLTGERAQYGNLDSLEANELPKITHPKDHFKK